MKLTRRETLLSAGGAAALVAAGAGVADAERKPKPQAAVRPFTPGKHEAVPLKLNPAKLDGISEKMIVSHHDNNYVAAVKNLNKVEEELLQITRETAGYVVGGLKQSELTYTNSIILHEHYFGNLGGNGKTDGAVEKRIAQAWGSFAKWEEEFRATGQSLGGGSGWTILEWNFHTGDLRTYWSGNHSQALAFGQPLLVMDMYEHAYQMDYGAAAAKYIDAFFRNIEWNEVNRRLERAQQAAAILRT